MWLCGSLLQDLDFVVICFIKRQSMLYYCSPSAISTHEFAVLSSIFETKWMVKHIDSFAKVVLK